MKNFAIIIIALVLFESVLQANTNPVNPTENKSLTVMANAGLTLRSHPDIHSSIIEIIPYGEKVKRIDSMEMTSKTERIEWVEGTWVEVEYEGQTGYVFDGFLAPFSVPQFEFEFCYEDLNLSYPLESWIDFHIESTQTPDTVFSQRGYGKVVHHLEDGQKMIEENKELYHKLTVEFADIRVMDAYHLLQAMIVSKTNRDEFKNQSVFIEDKYGKISRIKINLDYPITISQTRQGLVKVSVLTPNEGCSLVN